MPKSTFSCIRFSLVAATWDDGDGYFFVIFTAPYSIKELNAIKKIPNVFDIRLVK